MRRSATPDVGHPIGYSAIARELREPDDHQNGSDDPEDRQRPECRANENFSPSRSHNFCTPTQEI
jgi:hypothetical protein